MTKNLLSIAGYDPSGGAGVSLDLRVFGRLGFRGYGVLTSVTAQDASRARAAFPLPAGLVRSQVRALERGRRFAGIKVGMAGSLENLAAVAGILTAHRGLPRVVDPVFLSSSGLRLLERKAEADFLRLLRGKASLLTPNLDEASVLSGFRVGTVEAMKEAARGIHGASCIPCLVKGGHVRGKAMDVLYDGREFTLFRHPRLRRDVHGTGCLLSAAILSFLAGGRGLEEACRRGIALTCRSIRESIPAGGGRRVFSFPS